MPYSKKLSGAFVLTLAAILACYAGTRLAFSPVPWPDGSAFSLPGLDLVHWPPAWKMSCISAFVPSYERVNFQTMPGLSLVLGVAERIGFYHLLGPVEATRAVSLLILGAMSALLFFWVRKGTSNPWIAAVIAGALALDPVVRWGTLVVRTEIVIGLCWLAILLELSREGEPRLWRIAGALGTGAWFHFNAIVLVPGVALALAGPGFWRRMFGIAWRTLALLSPWLLLVAWHPAEFAEQMGLQFARLDGSASWRSIGAYSLFHGPFNSMGSPVSWPKFFNLAKGLFWILALGLSAATPWAPARLRRAWIAGAVGFWAALLIWIDKPEAWFTTLCHLFLWPWVGVAAWGRGRRVWVGLAAGFALVSVAVQGVQNSKLPQGYSYGAYHRWVACIEGALGGGAQKVWQPYAPDVLVELKHRSPAMQVTRALDFPLSEEQVLEFARGQDGIVYSTFLPYDAPDYQGIPRSEDLDRVGAQVAWGTLLGRLSGERRVCQIGPFWSLTFVRAPSTR